MADIGLHPIRMREATLHVEADSYTQTVNEVRIVPESPFAWATPFAHPDASFPLRMGTRWVAQLGFVQDLSTPGSLSTYLIEHAAQRKVITFAVPGMTVAATVMLLPGAFGGVIGQIPVATVSLPLYGAPDFTPATQDAA